MTRISNAAGTMVRDVYLIDVTGTSILSRSTYFPIGGGAPIVTTARTASRAAHTFDFLAKDFSQAEEISSIVGDRHFTIWEDALSMEGVPYTATADPQILPERAGDAIVRWRVTVEVVRS